MIGSCQLRPTTYIPLTCRPHPPPSPPPLPMADRCRRVPRGLLSLPRPHGLHRSREEGAVNGGQHAHPPQHVCTALTPTGLLQTSEHCLCAVWVGVAVAVDCLGYGGLCLGRCTYQRYVVFGWCVWVDTGMFVCCTSD